MVTLFFTNTGFCIGDMALVVVDISDTKFVAGDLDCVVSSIFGEIGDTDCVTGEYFSDTGFDAVDTDRVTGDFLMMLAVVVDTACLLTAAAGIQALVLATCKRY